MSVTVIIPTLNEESTLAETIRSLREQGAKEIVVADGGSTDATAQAAQAADHFVTTARGRANQMNAGAALAHRDTLLFLHADCRLEPGALGEIERTLQRPGVVAGCFRMEVQATGPLYRLIDTCATARVHLTGLIYGDQGLFLRRSVFERVGGFPRVRFLEDVLLSRRLRQLGRLTVARRKILVSPRRWQRQGLVWQTLRNWTLLALAAAGVSPDRLADFYPAVR